LLQLLSIYFFSIHGIDQHFSNKCSGAYQDTVEMSVAVGIGKPCSVGIFRQDIAWYKVPHHEHGTDSKPTSTTTREEVSSGMTIDKKNEMGVEKIRFVGMTHQQMNHFLSCLWTENVIDHVKLSFSFFSFYELASTYT
jgi:hypothetical protein